MRSERSTSWRPVAALALFDADRRLLLQQRPADKRHGGCWEFPGGKVEANETPRAALVREIAEELTLMLEQRDLCPASFAEEAGAPPIVLLLYEARRWSGPIIAREGQQWGWFAMADAARLDLAPMDAVLLAQLAA